MSEQWTSDMPPNLRSLLRLDYTPHAREHQQFLDEIASDQFLPDIDFFDTPMRVDQYLTEMFDFIQGYNPSDETHHQISQKKLEYIQDIQERLHTLIDRYKTDQFESTHPAYETITRVQEVLTLPPESFEVVSINNPISLHTKKEASKNHFTKKMYYIESCLLRLRGLERQILSIMGNIPDSSFPRTR